MVFDLLMQLLAEIPKPLESKSYTEFKMCILRLQRGEIKTLAIRDFVGLVDLLFNCLPYTLPASYLHHVNLFLLLKKKTLQHGAHICKLKPAFPSSEVLANKNELLRFN